MSWDCLAGAGPGRPGSDVEELFSAQNTSTRRLVRPILVRLILAFGLGHMIKRSSATSCLFKAGSREMSLVLTEPLNL